MSVISLFHALFHDNSGWHVTAVDLLSVNDLKGATDMCGAWCVHCVRAGQFMTGPPHTTVDCRPKLRGWVAMLRVRSV